MIETTILTGGNCSFINDALMPLKQNIMQNKQSPSKTQTMFFSNPVHIAARHTVVGEKESRGILGKYFTHVKEDIKLGEKSFERAEIKMLDEAVRGAIAQANMTAKDIDVLLSGDLLNQLTTSSYVARNLDIPHLGLYSACATMTESLALGASLISGGFYSNVACATSSHFATAERQFRYPLEYGCQRPPYAQWTVTAAACSVLSSGGCGALIKSATLGKVIDFGINDLSNMGAAMAPAAMDTMVAMFEETGLMPQDFDLILTGDLGKLGSDILRDLVGEKGYSLGQNYIDCGNLMYSYDQNCYQGGSGCGCGAAVVNEFALKKMDEGDYRRIAYLATGALMSTQSCSQGETIPSISHAIIIERE